MEKRKLFKTLWIVLVTCLMFQNIESQSNMFGTNAQHKGYYKSELTSNLLLSKKWSFKTNARIFSSAAISNKVVYFGSDDSCFYALNIDGSLKWKFKSNGSIRSTAAIKDTLVCFHNYGSMFYALDSRSGDVLWTFKADSEMVNTKTGINDIQPSDKMYEDDWDCYQSSPVYIDSIVYFGSGKYFYALNLRNGKLVWKYEAPLVIHSSPAIYQGVVYFGCWDSRLYALDVLTGTVKWIAPTGIDASHFMEGIQSSPTVIDSFVFISSRDANVYAFHAKTGKQIWKTSFGGSWMPSSFAVLNDTIYTGSSDGKSFYALDKFTGKIKYQISLSCYAFSTPAVTDNVAFIGSQNGSVFAIDLKTRKIICRFDTEGRKLNIINAIKKDGTMNPDVFNPVSTSKYEDSKEFVRRLYTSGSVLSSPVVDNNVVYFGSTDSSFYAVYNNNNCIPQFKVAESKIDLGEKISDVTIDTTFTITNTGQCLDSFIISIQYATSLSNGVILEEDNIILNPNESKKIKIEFDFSKVKTKNYTGGIIIKSKTNEYTTATISLTFKIKTGIADVSSGLLKTNVYPNPFKNCVSIQYQVEKNCNVDISIYNPVGQNVITLIKRVQTNGQYRIIWDGTNSHGNRVNAGMYYCTIRLDNQIKSYPLIYQENKR